MASVTEVTIACKMAMSNGTVADLFVNTVTDFLLILFTSFSYGNFRYRGSSLSVGCYVYVKAP